MIDEVAAQEDRRDQAKRLDEGHCLMYMTCKLGMRNCSNTCFSPSHLSLLVVLVRASEDDTSRNFLAP
jgi:hypothetical protein